MTKLFFKAGLLLSALLALSPVHPAQDGGRSAAATWRVQKYNFDVTLPPDASRVAHIKAVLELRNVSSSPAGTLTLRISPSADVSAVRLGGSPADITKGEEKIDEAASLQRLVLRMPAAAPNSIVNVAVDYKMTVKENSALASLGPGTAQFLPLSFWYPTPNSWYFARGADSAPFDITVRGGTDIKVVSAGTPSTSPGSITYSSRLSGQPFFLAGEREAISSGGITVLVPKGSGPGAQKAAGEISALIQQARTFTAAALGPGADVPILVTSARRGGGFASGGAFIVDDGVFRRGKLDSLTAMNLAEGVVRLWIGNTAVAAGDGYGVVSEGLVRYLATQFIEAQFGKDVADVERLRQRVAYAAVSKRDSALSSLSPVFDLYYTAVANKGAMAWRVIAKRVGGAEFAEILRSNMKDGELTLAELRAAMSPHKEILDHFFDQVTDTNLMIGLPQTIGGETKVNLRNSGTADVTVDIAATTSAGQKLIAPATIRGSSFGEVTFRSPAPVIRVEVDAEKLYPQTDYSDDIKPVETTDSDPLLAVKRSFDKQDFAGVEKMARTVLRDLPRFDDLRILLGRSLLAQGKVPEAEREFKAVLDEKLPTSRSIAWANVGLADIASKAGQNDSVARHVEAAILADAEYGASLAARNIRSRSALPAVEPAVKAFFAAFDAAASSNRKADVEALVMPGEATRFAQGVSGSTEQWKTTVKSGDRLDANTLLVEADMSVKLLNRPAESGVAVYRLSRVGAAWKLSGVEIFEVR